jgi:probable phosphoglycerate mutase
MTPARVIFVRHAEPEEAIRGRVYGSLDVELSPEGRAHSGRLAESLAREPIAAVYTSPLRRARDTAAPLAAALGLEPVAVDDLSELDFGELEGLTVDEVAARHPAQLGWIAAPANAAFPGGESVAALHGRATRAAREIAGRHAGEIVAAFSHSVTIHAIVADALGLPLDSLFRFELSHGGISVVDWLDGSPFVRAVNAPGL